MMEDFKLKDEKLKCIMWARDPDEPRNYVKEPFGMRSSNVGLYTVRVNIEMRPRIRYGTVLSQDFRTLTSGTKSDSSRGEL